MQKESLLFFALSNGSAFSEAKGNKKREKCKRNVSFIFHLSLLNRIFAEQETQRKYYRSTKKEKNSLFCPRLIVSLHTELKTIMI
jgi:hypothetical protein